MANSLRGGVCRAGAYSRTGEVAGRHRLEAQVVINVVDTIASRIAGGGDLVIARRRTRRRLVAEYLVARGHVEMRGDLVRPVVVSDGEGAKGVRVQGDFGSEFSL